MKSFEAEEDVYRMIERAKAQGVSLVHVCNTAVRKWLTEQGYARKKDLTHNKSSE